MSGSSNYKNRRGLVMVAAAAAAASSISLIPTCQGSSSSTPPSSSSSHIDPRSRDSNNIYLDGENQEHRNHNKPPSSSSSSKSSSKKKKKNKHSTAANKEDTSTKNQNKRKTETSRTEEEEDDVVSHILKLTDYYELLNISRTATDAQITKAYRRRAVQTHPDKMKNADRRAFDKIAQAYDTLKDANKRSLYDKLGHNTYLKTKDYPSSQSQSQQHPFQDVFSNFFQTSSSSPFSSSFRSTSSSSSSSSSYSSRMARNRLVKYQLDVTLEQLYTGTTIKLQRQKQFPSSSKNGSNVNTHEVTVPAGIQTGQTIRLSGEINDNPHDSPADMVFVIKQSTHPTYTRKGNDLAIELTLTIQEALCGFTNQPLLHSLSGKTLYLNSPTNSKIIKNGNVHCVEGWGMPKRNRRTYGDLYIQYKVELPNDINCMDCLTTKEREQLSILLSKLSPSKQQPPPQKPPPNNNEDDGSFLQKHERMIHPEKKEFENKKEVTPPTTVYLKESQTWKFGQPTNDEYEEEEDDYLQAEEEDDHSDPFSSVLGSSRGFQYFSSTNSNHNNRRQHPFFQNQFESYDTNDNNDDDGGNVQCQQM